MRTFPSNIQFCNLTQEHVDSSQPTRKMAERKEVVGGSGGVARRWYYESCVVEKEQKNTEYLAKPLSFTIQTSQLPCRQRYDQENTTENSEPHHCTLISSCIHRIHSCFVFFSIIFFLIFSFFFFPNQSRATIQGISLEDKYTYQTSKDLLVALHSRQLLEIEESRVYVWHVHA